MLTFLNNDIKLKMERVFDARYERGMKIMTDNEKELIRIIRENDNPEQALMTATAIILDFLKQHGSFEVQAVAAPRAHVEIN